MRIIRKNNANLFTIIKTVVKVCLENMLPCIFESIQISRKYASYVKFANSFMELN